MSTTTPAQIAANQANAKLSTGPKTAEGKAASSHNAVRTALTGRTVLLPTDDVEAYQKHVARFEAQYQPVTDREKELTQNIADTQWRLNRIFALEQGIYAVGRLEFAKLYENEDESLRSALTTSKPSPPTSASSTICRSSRSVSAATSFKTAPNSKSSSATAKSGTKSTWLRSQPTCKTPKPKACHSIRAKLASIFQLRTCSPTKPPPTAETTCSKALTTPRSTRKPPKGAATA